MLAWEREGDGYAVVFEDGQATVMPTGEHWREHELWHFEVLVDGERRVGDANGRLTAFQLAEAHIEALRLQVALARREAGRLKSEGLSGAVAP